MNTNPHPYRCSQRPLLGANATLKPVGTLVLKTELVKRGPAAAVVLDDYSHPEFPGVTQAVRALGLDGEERDGLFVHRVRRG